MPTSDPSPAALLEPLLRLLPQGDLPRTGWVLAGVAPPESVAAHVLGVAQLALALAPRVTPALDLGRTLAMALVHDASEALSGDLPRRASAALPAGAKAALDRALGQEVVAPLGDAARAALEEFLGQMTREARFVKCCDRLQLGVRLVGYGRAGRRGLGDFWRGLDGLDAAEFAPCAALLAELLAARATLREGAL
ncbi:MAG: HD domain-containing protein [Planctomycetota bacterium]